ncbi:MAG: hypothetical protein ACKESB_00845 [Candidatus Hodgkinia cicadicola]
MTELKPDKVLASCRLGSSLAYALVCDRKVSGPKPVDMLDLIKTKTAFHQLNFNVGATFLLKISYQLQSSDCGACFYGLFEVSLKLSKWLDSLRC